LAKTPRGWTGARTPSAIKRVRQAERRRAINQPRKSAAKTYVATAIKVAAGADEAETANALAEAMSALDKAAKVGAIHPNNAARRKSRLALRLNAMAEGTSTHTAVKPTKSQGTAASIKAARTRIAAAKAIKAKGPQTAAGKAKAALSKSARTETAPVVAAPEAPKAAVKAAKAPSKNKQTPKAETPVVKAGKAEKAPAKAKAEKAAPKAAAKAEKAPAKAKAEKAPAKPKAEKKPKA
jgi:ribosomal protein S20